MKVKLTIQSLILTNDGGAIIRTAPNEQNKTGIYKIGPKMLDSMVLNAGCDSTQQLKLMSEGSTLTYEATLCKAGEQWTNTKTGETGVYGAKNGGKDHWRPTNYEISLSEARKTQMILISGKASLNIGQFFNIGDTKAVEGSPIAVPAVQAAEVANEDPI